jgi:MFS transporter, SHS family, lactate transporter
VPDVWGRRRAMIIPALIAAFVTPLYLFTDFYATVAGAFIVQGAFLGAIYGQNPCYLSERFPTEVRATASGFCYHQGQSGQASRAQCLTYFAASQPFGFTVPMLIATSGAAVTLLFSPETKGKEFVPQRTLVWWQSSPRCDIKSTCALARNSHTRCAADTACTRR